MLHQSTILLGIDTSTEACSVAVKVGDQAVISLSELIPRGHAKIILDMLERILEKSGITLKDISHLVLSEGPGSFTGLRIAASAVQALSCVHQLPVIGVSTVQALAQTAYQTMGAHQVIALLDARMGEVYWGSFQASPQGIMLPWGGEVVVSDIAQVLLPEESGWTAVGTGSLAYRDFLQAEAPNVKVWDQVLYPLADAVVALGYHQLMQGESGVTAAEAVPQYVRNKVVQD